MKKQILFAVLGFTLTLSAQTDPIETYFNNQVWFQLAPHDSLLFDFTDSTGPYQNDGTQTLNFIRKGIIDTSAIYFGGNPSADEFIGSVVTGNKLTLTTYQVVFGGMMDTLDYYEFYKDANGQDTAMIIYADLGSGFEPIIKYSHTFAGGLLNTTEYFDYSSGVPEKGGQSTYYSFGNRIDSADIAITINGTNIVVQKTKNVFQGNKHIRFESYEISNPSTANFELTEDVVFTHDANDNIVEGISYSYDPSTNTKTFEGRVKYLRRKGSNVSLKENSISGLSVYPNPVKDVLNIEASQVFDYQITNVAGAIVLKGNSTTGALSVADLPNGLYHIAIDTQNGQALSTRFVKN